MREVSPFYRALVAKDRRFDGKVFFGVQTTGIYCRPICPARTPRPENVSFYPTAAAAEAAGFRACRRCRPETSPGTPAWQGTSATVNRALRFLSEGLPDEKKLSALGEHLGVTERHLRRLFVKHLGAPPHAIWQIRRLDFARRLLDDTTLPVTEIAFASGFESVRRFNAAFKDRFGGAPSEVRRKSPARAANSLHIKLPYRPPFAWTPLLEFLSRRAVPGLESLEEGIYRRAIEIDGTPVLIEVKPVPDDSYVSLSLVGAKSRQLMALVTRVRQIFDLEADPLAINDQLTKDRTLKTLLKKWPGIRVPGTADGFELAVRTVIGQQVSVAGARTLVKRLVHAFGREISFPSSPSIRYLFPTAAAIHHADLRGCGLTTGRIRTLRELARRVHLGELDLSAGPHLEETRRKLAEIPGLGPWSIEYIAMRALRDPNAFPSTDLVLRRALIQRKAQAQKWEPWRAYGALYLWNSPIPR